MEKLVTPGAGDPMPDALELFLNNNLFSLTYWANWFVVKTIGADPLAWATEQFTGDWEQMGISAGAIRNLADYNSSYSRALDDAAKGIDSWRGNAADSAREYFDDLRGAVGDQSGPLREISTQIEEFSLSSYYTAQGVSFLLQGIFDTAAIAIIKEVAAAAAAKTVYGLAAAAALQASVVADMAKMIGLWNQVLSKYATYITGGEAAIGMILNGVAILQSEDVPPLPNAGYDHPGV
ncbi:hypothetical protein HGA13_32225 [Nocardia speluncae]|uniref:Uncharacterized protein n=1 Tax=Nocardia speluncae TaxID=419477 RepID=A0A846XMZ2_9NOCA|nr:hypothetical protein [Nocardia speluncae]NKY37701.1 hypothetical protein [Nocardia speluncae]